MKIYRILILVLITFSIIGCTSNYQYYASRPIYVNRNAVFGLAPIVNQTTTPLVGQKATNIISSFLHIYGVNHLVTYHIKSKNKLPLVLEPGPSKRQIMYWARRNHIQYLITGSVNEWQYKVGFDGQPVVGMTLKVIDVPYNKVIWSSVGSSSGPSEMALSQVGQTLIQRLLNKFFYNV